MPSQTRSIGAQKSTWTSDCWAQKLLLIPPRIDVAGPNLFLYSIFIYLFVLINLYLFIY